MKKLAIAAALVAGFSSVALAEEQARSPTASDRDLATPEAPDSARQHEAVVVKFSTDASALSAEAKDLIKTMITQVRKAGRIEVAHVAVWSDREFPSPSNADLATSDQKLATARGQSIQNFLKKDLKIGDVRIYNMAKGTNWLAKLFNTEDAEIKKVLAGEENTLSANQRLEIRSFHDYGKASEAVVVVERAAKPAAH